MANEKTSTAPPSQAGMLAIVAPFAAWLVPGLGHVIQRRFVRGGLIFASIAILFFCGIAMQGRVYGFNLGDLLQMLGFVGDSGNGLLYFLARALDWGAEPVFRATSDYGTKYVVCSGLLNVVAAVDAYHIAIGKKS